LVAVDAVGTTVSAVGALILDVDVTVVPSVGSCVGKAVDAVGTFVAAVGAPVLDVGVTV